MRVAYHMHIVCTGLTPNVFKESMQRHVVLQALHVKLVSS
jgi:hypothetical protein